MLRRLATSLLLAVTVLPSAARTRPRYGDTLRVEFSGDPWQHPGGLARRLVYDGLTRQSPDGSLRPALALSWTSENNDHRWLFRLRPGVRFHDGSPVTTTGVAAALMASCTADCPWGTIHALSSSLVFTSNEPMPHLPALLAGDDFLISKSQGTDPDGGTGPFQVAGFANSILTLSANDAAWSGRPFADTIEIRFHRSVPDQWMDLAAGRADLVEVPAESIRQARQQHLAILVSPPVQVLALELSDSGPLSSPALRAAIGYAVDRSALANVIFQRQGIPTAALLPQALSGYAFLFPAGRDLNQAHQLRGGAGNPVLQIESGGDATVQLAAQRIVLNLREAGFAVQPAHAGSASSAIRLRILRVPGADAPTALAALAREAGKPLHDNGSEPAALYRSERDLLDRHSVIPLLDLPVAWAFGARVRDLQLLPDGAPDLPNASLEPSR